MVNSSPSFQTYFLCIFLTLFLFPFHSLRSHLAAASQLASEVTNPLKQFVDDLKVELKGVQQDAQKLSTEKREVLDAFKRVWLICLCIVIFYFFSYLFIVYLFVFLFLFLLKEQVNF